MGGGEGKPVSARNGRPPFLSSPPFLLSHAPLRLPLPPAAPTFASPPPFRPPLPPAPRPPLPVSAPRDARAGPSDAPTSSSRLAAPLPVRSPVAFRVATLCSAPPPRVPGPRPSSRRAPFLAPPISNWALRPAASSAAPALLIPRHRPRASAIDPKPRAAIRDPRSAAALRALDTSKRRSEALTRRDRRTVARTASERASGAHAFRPASWDARGATAPLPAPPSPRPVSPTSRARRGTSRHVGTRKRGTPRPRTKRAHLEFKQVQAPGEVCPAALRQRLARLGGQRGHVGRELQSGGRDGGVPTNADARAADHGALWEMSTDVEQPTGRPGAGRGGARLNAGGERPGRAERERPDPAGRFRGRAGRRGGRGASRSPPAPCLPPPPSALPPPRASLLPPFSLPPPSLRPAPPPSSLPSPSLRPAPPSASLRPPRRARAGVPPAGASRTHSFLRLSAGRAPACIPCAAAFAKALDAEGCEQTQAKPRGGSARPSAPVRGARRGLRRGRAPHGRESRRRAAADLRPPARRGKAENRRPAFVRR